MAGLLSRVQGPWRENRGSAESPGEAAPARPAFRPHTFLGHQTRPPCTPALQCGACPARRLCSREPSEDAALGTPSRLVSLLRENPGPLPSQGVSRPGTSPQGPELPPADLRSKPPLSHTLTPPFRTKPCGLSANEKPQRRCGPWPPTPHLVQGSPAGLGPALRPEA